MDTDMDFRTGGSITYYTGLPTASARGDVALVERLLQNGADVNELHFLGESALIVASENGHLAVVDLLLQNGTDVNALNFLHESALYIASENGRLSVVDLLLQYGANVDARNFYDESALIVASRNGHVSVVDLLLQYGANVNCRDFLGGSALSIASEKGHLSVVDILLQKSASIDARNYYNKSALIAASEKGHLAVVDLLLQNDADFDIQRDFSRTALRSTSHEGKAKVTLSASEWVRVRGLVREMRISAAKEPAMVERLARERAISSAALQDDWNNVRHFVAEGCDPNCGESFMKRPLAVAIMHANLEEAEFLLRNYAIRDLGDQFYPLRDAILRKNVEEAQAILRRPRSLKPPRVESKRQTLQRHFHETHKIFLIGSQSASVGQEYKVLATEMDSYRHMWRTGMAGVRRLIKNRSPQNFQQVIGILCVASAMRKSIQSEDTFGNYDLFLEDLDRWRELAVKPKQRMLFDEIAFAIWGKGLNPTRRPDPFDVQEGDRYDLFEAIRNMVQRYTTESSTPLAQLEHENFWDYYEFTEEISIKLYESRGSHNENCENANDTRTGSLSDLSAAPDHNPFVDDLAEGSDWDPGPQSLVPALLMMGAIFACIIHFLFELHSGHVFSASSRNLSTQLNTLYQTFVFQVLAALPSAEVDSDLASATTSTLVTLEGWALIDRCELVRSFLNCKDGWVPLEPPSFTGGSAESFSFDSESSSLTATTPAPSLLSGISTSTTSQHKCHICNKVISSTGNLNRHLKNHQNSWKHSCRNARLGCRYTDIRKDNVEKHEIKHCKWRKYV